MTDGVVTPCFLGTKSVPCDVTPLNDQWVPSGIEAETSQASPQKHPRVLGHHCPQLLVQQQSIVAFEVATRARVLLSGISHHYIIDSSSLPSFKNSGRDYVQWCWGRDAYGEVQTARFTKLFALFETLPRCVNE